MHIYPLSCYLIYAVDFTGNLGSAPSISNQVYGWNGVCVIMVMPTSYQLI